VISRYAKNYKSPTISNTPGVEVLVQNKNGTRHEGSKRSIPKNRLFNSREMVRELTTRYLSRIKNSRDETKRIKARKLISDVLAAGMHKNQIQTNVTLTLRTG
jgi:hypothetical protein